MKNYDDLQRFKEKTQTLDIAFKDMSGQAQDADHSQWAIIRQLAADDEPELGSGQRVDLPQPQPIRRDEFTAPDGPTLAAPPVSAPGAEPAPLNTSLFPPAPPVRAAASVMPLAPKATHVERQATNSLFPPAPPKPAVVSPPAAVSAPAEPVSAPVLTAPASKPAPSPSRFGALFRSRPAEPAMLSKETPLKPLLEKIALCR